MIGRRLLHAPLVLACLLAPAIAQAATADPMTRMFQWWDSAIKDPNGFTPESFGRYFTDDAVLILNGQQKARGLAALTEHFKRIQNSGAQVEIVLPFEVGFTAGDKIFTYHFIRSVRDGRRECQRVMGYGVTRDGKLALIHLTRVAEDPDTGAAACRGS